MYTREEKTAWQRNSRAKMSPEQKAALLAKRRLTYPARRADEAAKAKARRALNPEAAREKSRRWWAANKERGRALVRKWRYANKEKALAAVKRWRLAHLEAGVHYVSKHRALKRGQSASLTPAQWLEILARSTACVYCTRLFNDKLKPTMDHVQALSKGGAHSKENIVAACKPCNSAKNNRTSEAWAAYLPIWLSNLGRAL